MDLQYTAPEGFAIVALGLRASDGRLSTMRLQIQRINEDGTLGERRDIFRGSAPRHWPEGMCGLPVGYVAVGFGVQIREWWDVATITLWGAPLNRDGSLGPMEEFRGGFTPNASTEKQILLPPDRLLVGVGVGAKKNDATGIMAMSATCSRYSLSEETEREGVYAEGRNLLYAERTHRKFFAPENHAITGVVMRAAEGEITTMNARIQPILPDGTLGEAVSSPASWMTHMEPEAHLDLPEGYVAVGIGLSIRPIADVEKLVLWGAPLHSDGTLGEVELFIAGFQSKPEEPLQKVVMCPPGEILSGFGFAIDNDGARGILATSARLMKN